MGRRLAAFLAAALSAASAPALGCGYCVEDKIAAVYDHGVVSAATALKHQVVFFAVDGAMPADVRVRTALQSALAQSRGIDAGSLRLSADAAALSVAFDPRRAPLATVQRELERRLLVHRLSLLPLRVMDRPAELKTVSAR